MSKNVETKADAKTPKSKKKAIGNIIFIAVQVLLVVVCIVISAYILENAKSPSEATSVTMVAIRSQSMMGDKEDNFDPGALVYMKKYNGEKLAVGTIIAFCGQETTSGGQHVDVVKTHRIIEVVESNNGYVYRTQGDNTTGADNPISSSKVLGVYKGHTEGLGSVILWLQGFEKVKSDSITGPDGAPVEIWDVPKSGKLNSTNMLVVVLPLIALLLWNAFSLISAILKEKMAKEKEKAAAAAVEAAGKPIDEEEIKRKAIEEYLRSIGQAPAEQNDTAPVDQPEETDNASEEVEVSVTQSESEDSPGKDTDNVNDAE